LNAVVSTDLFEANAGCHIVKYRVTQKNRTHKNLLNPTKIQ